MIFISWLVANIGMIFRFIVFAILEICLFALDLPLSGIEDYEIATLAIAMYSFLGGELCGGLMDGAGLTTDIINLLIIGVLYAFMGIWLLNIPEAVESDSININIGSVLNAFWGIIPCFIISVLTAIYAAVNFDDVVDRRMRYRNSDVAMYEAEILYSFNRFVSALSGSTFLYITITLLIAII